VINFIIKIRFLLVQEHGLEYFLIVEIFGIIFATKIFSCIQSNNIQK